MRLTKTIKIFIAVFILLNFLISFSAIWFLTRENHEVNTHVKKSIAVLAACHSMLEDLETNDFKVDNRFDDFFSSLKKLNSNISSTREKKATNIIIRNYKKAFLRDDEFSKNQIRYQIQNIAKINRNKILQFKNLLIHSNKDGAWAIVFLQSFIFLITIIIFIRFKKEVLSPLEEIYDVVCDTKKEDSLRRCSISGANHEMRVIGEEINNLLDEKINYERQQH